MAEQAAFDTPITADGSFIRLPLRNSDVKFEKRPGPVDREFGVDGTLKNLHFLGSFVSGTIECYPRLDSQAFHWLLGHAMGDETYIADEWVNGVANATSELRAYKATTNVSEGLTLRTLLAGQTAAGHYDEITGLIPTGWFVEFPADGGRPYFGFPCLGKTKVAKDSSGWASPPLDLGTVRVKPSDYDIPNRTNAHYKTGEKVQASLNDWGFRSLRIEYQRALELNDPYTSSPGTTIKPVKNGKNNVIVRAELDLEQIKPYSGQDVWHPKYLFDTEGEGIIDFVLESLTSSGAALPYAMRFNLPRIKYRSVTEPFSQGGIITQTVEGQVLGLENGITTRAGIDEAASSVLAFGADSDVRIFVANKTSDSPRGAAKTYSAQLPSAN